MRHSDERHATMRELTCERCGAEVTVTKFSQQHTSVQWTSDSARTCAEFAEAAVAGPGGPGGQRARVRGCASLWDSIDRAVAYGRLEVDSP
jgi:hypothetical protein